MPNELTGIGENRDDSIRPLAPGADGPCRRLPAQRPGAEGEPS